MPGKFHGLRSLADYNPWGRKETDMTEQLTHTQLRETFNCIKTFLVVITGKWSGVSSTGPRCVKARDAAKHLTMHRTAPITKN